LGLLFHGEEGPGFKGSLLTGYWGSKPGLDFYLGNQPHFPFLGKNGDFSTEGKGGPGRLKLGFYLPKFLGLHRQERTQGGLLGLKPLNWIEEGTLSLTFNLKIILT